MEKKTLLFPPVKHRVHLYFKKEPTLIDALAVVSQLNDAHIERSGENITIVIDGEEN